MQYVTFITLFVFLISSTYAQTPRRDSSELSKVSTAQQSGRPASKGQTSANSGQVYGPVLQENSNDRTYYIDTSGANQRTASTQSNNTYNRATVTPTPVPPLPRTKVLVSAFKAWGTVQVEDSRSRRRNSATRVRRETNMALLVGQEIVNKVRSDARNSHIDIDYIELDVSYQRSSEALARHIMNMREMPDLVISIGQNPEKDGGQISIETSAHGMHGIPKDINNFVTTEKTYEGFENRIGFNFPSQDMYCSLPAHLRKRVTVGYTGGNFVCNDIAYNMALFSKGADALTAAIDAIESRALATKNNKVRNIQNKMNADIAAAEAEYNKELNDKRAELDRCENERNAIIAENQRIRQQGERPDNRVKSVPVCPWPRDPSIAIRNQAQADINAAEREYQSEVSRSQRFRNQFTAKNKTKFVFIHVPSSDGIEHQPEYEIQDAICVDRNFNHRDWVSIGQASQYTGDNERKVERDAEDILESKEKRGDFAEGRRSNSLHPNACKNPQQVVVGQKFKRYNKDTKLNEYEDVYGPATKYVIKLRSFAGQAEIQEDQETRTYADIILRMLNGSLRMSQEFRLSDSIGLPTMYNDVRFPTTKQGLDQLLYKINMSEIGYQPKESNGAQQASYPQVLTPNLASCYREVIEMIKDNIDEDARKRRDAIRKQEQADRKRRRR